MVKKWVGYAFVSFSFLNHQLEMKKSENLVGSGTTKWEEPGFLNQYMKGHLLNNVSDFGAKN